VVADEWGLPQIIAEAMTHYKDFNAAPTAKEIAGIVLFASQIASHMLDPEEYELDTISTSRALEVVNLYPDEVTALLNKVETVKSSVAALSI
jgi:HD-like signal output (HDOD) protein